MLVHELAHSFMAKALGIRVHAITLYLFGGAPHANVESRGPLAEFATTIVGPLSSFTLAGGLWAASIAAGPEVRSCPGHARVPRLGQRSAAVFNLLPGLPLDGEAECYGPCRCGAQPATSNGRPASRRVAGQIVGYLMVAFGTASVLVQDLGGLWLAFIGWFIAQSARAAGAQARRREAQHQLRPNPERGRVNTWRVRRVIDPSSPGAAATMNRRREGERRPGHPESGG